MDKERTMDERTKFLHAMRFSQEEREEQRRVEEWVLSADSEHVAAYIVWLQREMFSAAEKEKGE
jgi:hypothetical protein